MLKHEAHIIARMSLIDEMTPAVGNMNKKLKGTAKQASAVKQQFKFMRGGMGQVGHQVQDIAVQLQMGQNAMLVFGQQGSQIASLFGPHGAIIGAFLAVGAAIATSLMPSFFGASEVMKQLKKDTEDLGLKLNELTGAQRELAAIQLSQSIKGVTSAMEEQADAAESSRMSYFDHNQQRLVYLETEKEYADRIVLSKTKLQLLTKQQELYNHAQEGGTVAGKKRIEQAREELAIMGLDSNLRKLRTIKLLEDNNDISKSEAKKLRSIERARKAYQEAMDDEKAEASERTKAADALAAATAAEEKANKIRLASLRRTLSSKKGLLEADYNSNKALIEQEVKDEAEKYSLLLHLREKYQDDLKKLANADKKMSDELKEFRDTYRPIFNEFGDGFVDAITGAEKFSDAIRNMAKNVIDSLLRIMMQKMIFDQLFGAFESSFGPTANSGTGGGSGGSRTLGGPVQQGRSVLVGERGPEIFTPSSAGQITPNNEISGGGGVTIVQHINVTTGVQQTVRAEIKQLMPQIAQAAKGAVADARLRGGSFSKAMGTT
tara:strand:+ start:3963 stop:5606 length:1644 start_codon:yes stop_codon:yes gene_type:complete